EVTFDIDASGILTVTAKDKASNKVQSIRVEGSLGLSDEEIEKMKKEAELNASEDKKKRDLIEAKNNAENLIYTVEKTLKEAEGKVSEEDKKPVLEKLEELKKIKDSDNLEEIKTKTDEVSTLIQQIGAKMYQANSASEEKKEESNVEEAETEEVKDNEENKENK
ncbi:MAG: Hsp70 family protein, partial [Candidatus Pacebacteria bacterium]|nr:Hsp70 family protein [Candidatus Paceibacterota bacterium]